MMIGGMYIAGRRTPKGVKSKARSTLKKRPANKTAHKQSVSPKGFSLDATLFKSVVDHSPNTISILNKDGTVIYSNPAVKQVYGSSKKNVEKRSLLENIHPKDIARIKKIFAASLKGHGVNIGILPVTMKDGSYRYLDVANRVINDSSGNPLFVSYYSDVTAHMESDIALKDSEERYRILADTAQDMIFIVDRNLLVEYVNKSSAEQFHAKPEKIIGKPLSNLFPSFIYKRQKISLEKVFKSGKPLYVANDTPFPTGQRLLDTWLVPINDKSGKVKSVFGVSRDVTRFKLSEIELERKTKESDEAKVHAQIYFDFLAHDIANLISPVLTYSQLLLEADISDPHMKDHLIKLRDQTQRTATFIMDLKMLSEAQKVLPESSDRFDIGRLFLDMAKMVRAKFQDKCDISLDFPEDQPMEVFGGIHIRNAFMMGFSRAMATSTDDCMKINVKIRSIKRRNRPFWQVRMEIKGRTMSEDWAEDIVTPFDPVRRSRGKTVGRLSFSAAIIYHFGGTMMDENIDDRDPSKGHAITIELPKAGSWHTTRNT